jgi:hypothetical protein
MAAAASGRGDAAVTVIPGWSERRAALYDGVIDSFTAATSWVSVNGFGKNANC